LNILGNQGFTVANSDKIFKACLLNVAVDSPASAKMAGLSGHVHTYPSKVCDDKRVTYQKKHVVYSETCALRSNDLFKTACEEMGQKLATPFANLETFYGSLFFPIDLMHLMERNLGPQIHQMVVSKEYDSEKPNLLKLSNNTKTIEGLLEESRLLVPTIYFGDFKNFGEQGGFNRAIDWIHFMRFIVCTTLLSFWDTETQIAIIAISRICNITCQREIDDEDLVLLAACVDFWCLWLISCIKEKQLAPWVLKLNIHPLQHLCIMIEYLGPMACYSSFSMETTIGPKKDT
jgi:hypothetical protein